MRMYSARILTGLALSALLLAVAGCDKHNRRDEEYYVQPVPTEPAKPYEIQEKKDKNGKDAKYAVLQQGSVVSENINGWKALSPEFFAKLSGITVQAPEEDKTPHPGRSPFRAVITKSEKYPERQWATVYMGGTVPKELHGWAVVEQAKFEDLIKEFLTKP